MGPLVLVAAACRWGAFAEDLDGLTMILNLLRFSLAGVKVVFTLESDAGSRRCCIRVVGVPFLVQRSVICYTSCDPCTWYWYPGQAGVLFGVELTVAPSHGVGSVSWSPQHAAGELSPWTGTDRRWIEFTPFLFDWRQRCVYLGIGCRKPAMLYTSGWSALFGPTVSDLLYFM